MKLRTEEEVVWGGLWPARTNPDPYASRRSHAIYHVLARIPQGDYDKLAQTVDAWQWFVPPLDYLAGVLPFFITSDGELLSGCTTVVRMEEKTKHGSRWREETLEIPDSKSAPSAVVLYLSPRLELTGWNIVVACVAHELAHLALGHRLILRGEEYEAQEKEAWELVSRWEFGKEAGYHKARAKRLATLDAKLIEKLKAEARARTPKRKKTSRPSRRSRKPSRKSRRR